MRKYRIIIVIITLLIIGVLIYPSGSLKPAKNVLYVFTKPFTIAGSFTIDKVTLFFRDLAHLGSLANENQKLIKENLELQSQMSLLKEAQHENEILKKEIGFYNTRKDLKLLPANIIGRSISGYLRTIIIDRGTNDGVKTGQAVVSDGYLVGTVQESLSNSSEVILITDYNSLVPVVLQDSRGTGLLRGGLSGLTVEDIPLNVDIKSGEQVVTSGLGGEIPFGVLVGKVNEVVSKKGEIFQKANINSPIQIYFLEFVFVVQ
ncbi:MAG: mreC [Candidatus Berkelbacteria bacterium]|nr:mreC [Candidatus Berkelbacteria bacterium]